MEVQEYKFMSEKDKRMLLAALCEMMPYNVICHTRNGDYKLLGIDMEKAEVRLDAPIYDEGDDIYELHCYGDVMPYLRPMESMTDEERDFIMGFTREQQKEEWTFSHRAYDYLDLLLKWNLDFRGLIGLGLALPAKDGIYQKH